MSEPQGTPIAEGQSAEGIVDEKSVGKIPRVDAGPSKAGKVSGPTGSPKGSGSTASRVGNRWPVWAIMFAAALPNARFAECSRDAPSTSPAYSPSTRSVRSVGWEGVPARGLPIPLDAQVSDIAQGLLVDTISIALFVVDLFSTELI